ncbi:hypothetical protein ACOJCA_00525, partial [Enterobacter sp. BH2-YP2023]
QVTADVAQLTEHQHLLAAHCDPKGKMWSNLRLFRRQDGFAFIERRSLRDAQLKELKKYAVFSISVVTGVGFLIHMFASWYMRGEEGYSRFFAYTNLFIASMVVL